jgi:DNA polymerase
LNGCSPVERIDWDEVERLEDAHQGLRTALNTDLSEVYVSGEGDNPEALIIGEAPGAQEELLRRPFVGPSGRVMRDLMAIAGLYSAYTPEGGVPNCWLTNTIKFRPPRNRKPNPLEIRAFRYLLADEWTAIGKPRVIVPVGEVALQAVTGKPLSILNTAGRLHKYRTREGIDVCIWPMVHPSYGIRGGPSVQAILEQDWETFADWMKRARRFGWLDRNRI